MTDSTPEPMSAAGTAELAWLPEQCPRLLLAALERGDLEATVALYEPGAALFEKSGKVLVGHEAIRVSNAALIGLKPRFTIVDIVATVSGDGTLATTRVDATLEGVRADGSPVHGAIHTLEVQRKQADGSWRYVIDDPYGSMRAGMRKA